MKGRLSSLFRLLLAWQRLVRTRTNAVKTRLSLSQGQILGEIQGHPQITSGELGKLLKLEKSTVCRLLKDLVDLGYLDFDYGISRGRSKKPIKLTAAGRRLLILDDRARSSVSEDILFVLAENERREFTDFFCAIADGFSVPPGELRPSEHPVRLQQRRLTQAFGLLGNHFVKEGLTIVMVQILFFLDEKRAGLTLRELGALLPFDLSTISRSMKKLLDDGLVLCPESKERKRKLFRLSSKGCGVAAGVESAVEQHLESSIPSQSHDLIKKGQGLLEKVIKESESSLLCRSGILVIKKPSASEIAACRAKLVECLIRRNLLSRIPARLFVESSVCYGLFRGTTPEAACSFSLAGQKWELESFWFNDAVVTVEEAGRFLRKVLRDYAYRYSWLTVEPAENIFLPRVLKSHALSRACSGGHINCRRL